MSTIEINKATAPVKVEKPHKGRFEKMWSSPSLLNVLYIPALILFVLFILYPFITGIQFSFTSWNGYSQNYKWIG
ncbi:MAG: sugar ABC transporter permease, partial [Bacilli bacterium]